ncbi:hypothetical protein [Actinobacillus minor]|nr:hypothetical protein [Actinobacillus minor]
MRRHITLFSLSLIFAVVLSLDGCETSPVLPKTSCHLCEFTEPS